MQAPTLSHLLRGSRPFTRNTILSVSKRLGLGPEIFSESAKEPQLKQLTLDSFAVISDWYHFAILELVNLKHFKPEAKWIAKVLGITPSEVNIAVERLVRLELLKTEKKRWCATSSGNSTIGTELTTIALRKVQKQFLEKALTALESVEPELRDQTGVTFPIAVRDLPQMKEEIKKFRRQLIKQFEKPEGGDEVYQLSCSLYPLTKTQE